MSTPAPAEHDDVTAAMSDARSIVRRVKFYTFDRELGRFPAITRRHPHRSGEIRHRLHVIARSHGLLSRHVMINAALASGVQP